MDDTARRTRTLLSVALGGVEGPPLSCPSCGAPSLRPVPGSECAVMACTGCDGRWAVQLGYLVPVGRGPRTASRARTRRGASA